MDYIDLTLSGMFQSTPRFVGEGNQDPAGHRPDAGGFTPPPALSAGGTVQHGVPSGWLRVSIHPPLCRRGEQRRLRWAFNVIVFQSTPRFVGEGNMPHRREPKIH